MVEGLLDVVLVSWIGSFFAAAEALGANCACVSLIS